MQITHAHEEFKKNLSFFSLFSKQCLTLLLTLTNKDKLSSVLSCFMNEVVQELKQPQCLFDQSVTVSPANPAPKVLYFWKVLHLCAGTFWGVKQSPWNII